LTQCSDELLLIRGFCSHVLAAIISLLLSLSLTLVAFIHPDAVVLWDWIISLPREYRFVSVKSGAYIRLFIAFSIGLEYSLDSSQDGISLLQVSLYDTTILFYIINILAGTGSLPLCHTFCIVSLSTIHWKCASVYLR
jgi:hypothetical protein